MLACGTLIAGSASALVAPPYPVLRTTPLLSARHHQVVSLYTPEKQSINLLDGLKQQLLSFQGAEEEKVSASESSTERSLQPRRNPVDTTRSVDDSEGALWPYQLAMLVITACWGANFAVTSWSLDALGGDATDGTLFVAARFLVGAGALVPFLASANSMAVCIAGAQVGALCAAGYAAQSVSLALGTEAGTAAFICSLQSVVVALGASTKTGGVARQTWLAVALSIAGVGCLELLHDPSSVALTADVGADAATAAAAATGGGASSLLGDVIALGQPLGFGLSYVVLEDAMAKHPEDELPLAALQCILIAIAAVGAAAIGAHTMPWQLHWEHLLPTVPSSEGAAAAGDWGATLTRWGVPLAIAYTGLISTSLTIWLQAKVFKRLPSTDASIILSSEPLWAVVVAAVLLHAEVGVNTYVGGTLILSALACNQGLLDGVLAPLLGEGDAEDRKTEA